MKLTLFSLASALAALAAAPAMATPADDLVSHFRQVCADTHGDYPAVTGAVAKGWKASTAQAESMPKVVVSDRTARTMEVNGATVSMAATTGKNPAGILVTTCTVQIDKPSKVGDLQTLVQGWLTFPASEADASHAVFRFTDDGSARKAVPSTNADFDAAAAGPGLQLLTVRADSSSATLDLVKIKK